MLKDCLDWFRCHSVSKQSKCEHRLSTIKQLNRTSNGDQSRSQRARRFLTVVFMLRSFHPPDTENTQLSIHRTDMIALYASSMTSKADYDVFVPNSKSYAKTKMAEIPRTKQVRILLKYLKLTLMAELSVSLCLLTCGDISSNQGPTKINQTGNDTFPPKVFDSVNGTWTTLQRPSLMRLGRQDQSWHPGDYRDFFL